MSLARIAAAALTATLSFTSALAGQFQTIYQFQDQADGTRANAIAWQNGTIFGVSTNGPPGKGRCASGCGTVFALNPQQQKKTTLYVETDPNRGYLDGIVLLANKAYLNPGFCSRKMGCLRGALGQVDLTTGKEKTLYEFGPNTTPGTPGQFGVHGGILYAYDLGAPSLGFFQYNLKTKLLTTLAVADTYPSSPFVFLRNSIIYTNLSQILDVSLKTKKLKILHQFTGGANDGDSAVGPLYSDGTTIFGAALTGGIQPPGNSGYGVVYKLDIATRAENILHFFDFTDGAGPNSGLVYMNGKLYGTTLGGGATPTTCGAQMGCGTIFEIDPATGSFTSLYQFQAGADGYYPYSLVAGEGVLYGTAQAVPTKACPNSCGQIFSFTP